MTAWPCTHTFAHGTREGLPVMVSSMHAYVADEDVAEQVRTKETRMEPPFPADNPPPAARSRRRDLNVLAFIAACCVAAWFATDPAREAQPLTFLVVGALLGCWSTRL